MEFGSLDGGENNEYNGVGIVQISDFFAMRDEILFTTKSFHRDHSFQF